MGRRVPRGHRRRGDREDRVIVERCRYLLEHQEGLLPEQILVLTYNVKAAQQLQQRLDATVGRAMRARMTVSNFHSFCQRILTETAADAGLPPRPDVLDGVGQVLLLTDLAPDLPLSWRGPLRFDDAPHSHHSGAGWS